MTKSNGFAGKILIVDLTTSQVRTIDTDPYKEYMGGRAMGARMYWDYVSPDCSAFDPENAICMAASLSAGVLSPGGGRLNVSTKSPATFPECYQTSTTGGHVASELRFAGYDGLIIQGKAESPVYLRICNDTVEIRPASRLWGMGVRQTDYELKNLWGIDVRNMIIGPAGENMNRYAAIISDFSHATGQGGFGAVMGSKNLKAICIRGDSCAIPVGRPKELMEMHYNWVHNELPNPAGTFNQAVLPMAGGMKAQPHKLWPVSDEVLAQYRDAESLDDRFDDNNDLAKMTKMREYMDQGELEYKFAGCFSCPGPCHFTAKYKDVTIPITPMNMCHQTSAFYPQDLATGTGKVFGKSEYLWSALCVDYGMSVDVFGQINAWIDDLIADDVVTAEDFQFPFEFDPKSAEDWLKQETIEQMIHDVCYKQGSELFHHIGDGVDYCLAWLASERGGKAEEIYQRFCIHRNYNSTDGTRWPNGGDAVATICSSTDYRHEHHAPWVAYGNGASGWLGFLPTDEVSSVIRKNANYWAEELFGKEQLNDYGLKEKDFTGKAEEYVFFQDMEMEMDTMSYCAWCGFPRFQSMWKDDKIGNPGIGADMYNAIVDPEQDRSMTDNIYSLDKAVAVMRSIHVREGRRHEHDIIQPIWFEEKFQTRENFIQGLQEFYEARGWDADGVPKRSALEDLGLKDVADDLENKYGVTLSA